eukprot:scaffold7892_cov77-Skeletonema_dohrnii-CCMP3373.AAC.2
MQPQMQKQNRMPDYSATDDVAASASANTSIGVEKPTVSAPDLFLTEAFHNADIDGDGRVSYEELKDLLRSLGLQEDELKLNKFVRAVDGTIDLDEFQSIIDKMNKISFEQHLRETFKLYDEDGSEGIDHLEVKTLLAQLGIDLTDEESSAMIAEVDGDGNGVIDYSEFLALFKGIKVSREEKKQQQQSAAVNVVLQGKDSVMEGTVFDDAKQMMSFSRVFRFVIWLYSERKMILLALSHFVATMVIWGECPLFVLVLLLPRPFEVSDACSIISY